MNLCRHFWRIVASILLYLGVAALVLAIGSLPVVYAWAWYDLIINGIGEALILVIPGTAGIVFMVGVIVKRSFFNEPKPTKPPNLVLSYIKARKEHYCPLIEVVED